MPVRGTTQSLTATFRSSPGGPLVDPSSLTLVFTLDGTTVYTAAGADIVHDGPGLYRYEWAIPLSADPGVYTAVWSAILPGDSAPSVGYETVEVTEVSVPQVPTYAGCMWPMDPACATDEWAAFPTDVQNRALAMASATMTRLTGGRVGNCPITVRPAQRQACSRFSIYPMPWPQFTPVNWGGMWSNVICCPDSLTDGIPLPPPVSRIDEVKVDGLVLDPSKYTVVNRRRLIWRGIGAAPWNLQQDLSLPDTAIGTFSVTYLNADPVDSNGAYAVGVLALEFANACTGGRCRLSDNVTSVVRQGITMEIASGSFPNGETGIREVDSYIALWNPGHLRREATVWSPDVMTYSTGG